VPQTLAIRLASFTAVMAVLGCVAAAICGSVAGAAGLEAVAWAFGLCVIPGWVVLALQPLARSPLQLLKLVLIGTGVRVAIVAGGAVAVLAWRSLPRDPFLLALLVLYFASLAWETWVLKSALPQAGGARVGSAS
jgi:hypothetical protein